MAPRKGRSDQDAAQDEQGGGGDPGVLLDAAGFHGGRRGSTDAILAETGFDTK